MSPYSPATFPLETKYPTDPAEVIVEIVSEDDRYVEILEKLADYHRWGRQAHLARRSLDAKVFRFRWQRTARCARLRTAGIQRKDLGRRILRRLIQENPIHRPPTPTPDHSATETKATTLLHSGPMRASSPIATLRRTVN